MTVAGEINEAYDLFSKLSWSDFQLIMIGVTAFLSGYLILFYLRRINPYLHFKKLEFWEKLVWSVIFGILNGTISILLWFFGVLVSIILYSSSSELISERMPILFNFSLMIVPYFLYSSEISNHLKKISIRNYFYYFSVGVLLLSIVFYLSLSGHISNRIFGGMFISALLLTVLKHLKNRKFFD